MLDIKKIKEDVDFFKKNLSKKGVDPKKIDILVSSYNSIIEIGQTLDKLRSEKNSFNKTISSLKGEEKTNKLSEMKEVASKIKTLETELGGLEEEYKKNMSELPNIVFDEVPSGGEDDFKVLKEVGEIKKFNFTPKEHWEIAENLGILDTKRAAKVSGSRFFFLKGDLAVLQMALMNWAFLEVQKMGFLPIIPPFMTRSDAIYGTGYLEKGENYIVNPEDDNLYLIATSEVPLVSYHANEILNEGDLPKKFAGYSPCFRKEAGSYGKDTKGILRNHQFEKIEMVTIASPEEAKKIHDQMLEISENILKKLKIPYRVILVADGDLGNSAAKKYDIEAWLPGQNKYREMNSLSNCTDFQSRRLGIKIRKKDGEIVFAHILNGTVTSSRPLIAILENFQNEDGSVDIPEVLIPFTNNLKKIYKV